MSKINSKLSLVDLFNISFSTTRSASNEEERTRRPKEYFGLCLGMFSCTKAFKRTEIILVGGEYLSRHNTEKTLQALSKESAVECSICLEETTS